MKYLSLVILLLSVFACRKKPPVYPTKQYEEFTFHSLNNFGPYRLFTKTGEITNAGLVAYYANEYSHYFFTPSSSISATEYKSFSFVNHDSVINTGINPVGELKRAAVGDYDVFTSKYSTPINDTNELSLHLGKYKLHKPATTPLGYTYFELNDPAAILKKVNDKLYVPIVRYIITSTGQNSFSFTASRFNNAFDPTGIRKLGTNDTLLIQTFDLELRRKQ